MPCYRPLDAYVIAGKTENGKKIIAFKKQNNWIERVKLPCGQCIGCKLLRSVNWAVRCEHEMSLHEQNCFITLTYDEENLPQDYSLRKDHFINFMKRLRRAIDPVKVRYFMCGEYGEQSWRPHYHAILFGFAFPDKIQVQFKEVENPYFLSPLLKKLWKFGNHMIANATFETAAYCARYCTKKITGDLAEEHYNRTILKFDEDTGEIETYLETVLEPEYATMSRRPGIGKGWFEKYKSDCYPTDFLIRKGNKLPVPRYYDKLIEREDEVMLAQIKVARELHAKKDFIENTGARLIAREHCKRKQLETLKRNKI